MLLFHYNSSSFVALSLNFVQGWLRNTLMRKMTPQPSPPGSPAFPSSIFMNKLSRFRYLLMIIIIYVIKCIRNRLDNFLSDSYCRFLSYHWRKMYSPYESGEWSTSAHEIIQLLPETIAGIKAGQTNMDTAAISAAHTPIIEDLTRLQSEIITINQNILLLLFIIGKCWSRATTDISMISLKLKC